MAVEVNSKKNLVYKIGKFSSIFKGVNEEEEFDGSISIGEYEAFRKKILDKAELVSWGIDDEAGSGEKIYKILWNGELLYFRVVVCRTRDDNSGISDADETVFKMIFDCTDEMMRENEIRRQRDLDFLTGLLNRLSFKEKTEKFINEDTHHVKKAAMIMWDLDNLKFVNDTYGHENGDKYLCHMADNLKKLQGENSFVARVSGDEFFAFIEYKEDRQEIRNLMLKLRMSLVEENIPMPDDSSLSIKATTGIAWYPEDAKDYYTLVKYADFAMYTAKHYKKGIIEEFSREEYDRDYIIHSGDKYFEDFINNREVKYAFQPIVDTKTGEIFGYEALMRPTSAYLSNISQLMKFAKKETRLEDIEWLTIDEVLGFILNHTELLGDKKVFVNSIANIMLTDEHETVLLSKYSSILERVVVEITEQEDLNHICMEKKQDIRSAHNMKMAIDDFGAGYSTQSWLLQVRPDFIKVDIMLVRDIDRDAERRLIVENILDYARKMNIKTICEGVETYAEMKTLIEMGADYLQGYYLARPDFEIKDISENVEEEIREINAGL